MADPRECDGHGETSAATGIGWNRGDGQRRSTVLGGGASRDARMVEDAAEDAAFGYEGDDPHHALAPGKDERIDLVRPSKELSPSAPKSG